MTCVVSWILLPCAQFLDKNVVVMTIVRSREIRNDKQNKKISSLNYSEVHIGSITGFKQM